jgi:uncharacterized protein
MPYHTNPPSFERPFGHWGGHLQTILPGALRRIDDLVYTRERIETPDDDFLDLDWVRMGAQRLVVITHGLEGSSHSQYVRGTARLFAQEGWDVLAWNCRSCSGEMNRQFRLYHHGEIGDIDYVIRHAIRSGGYQQVGLAGFSMGANITMKYLGVHGSSIPKEVKSAAVFSAPCDLGAGADVLDKPDNFIYRKRFMRKLVKKLTLKSALFPNRLDISKLKDIKRWRDFDEWFSAPMSGYRNAAEFYHQASPLNFMEGIAIPTLLASAVNDPILTPDCFPIDIAKTHKHLHLELPLQGGHCGFMVQGSQHSWMEMRALAWLGAGK